MNKKLTKKQYLSALVSNAKESITVFETTLITEKNPVWILNIERFIIEAKIRLEYYQYAVDFSPNQMIEIVERLIAPVKGCLFTSEQLFKQNYLKKQLRKIKETANFANQL